MKNKNLFLGAICLVLFSCTSSNNPDSSNLNNTSVSRENAIQCLDQGNISCAQNDFCSLQSQNPNDASLALRCCTSQFLTMMFSDNTQSLGKMLGYSPTKFESLKSNTLPDLISKKKIVFGELIFLPQGQSPKLRDLVMQWGEKVTSDHTSTHELNQKFIQLGKDLEGVSQCLNKLPQSFPEDELEGNFFGSKDKIKVTSRDIDFLQFASQSLSYLAQSVFEYDWGFDYFPSWPFDDSFYQDINGKMGVGDKRFGDISADATTRVAGHAPLLKSGLQSFDNFLHESKTGLIDAWLRWRFTQDDLIIYTSVLQSANASLNAGQWMSVSGKNFILNTSSLLHEETLPNAKDIPPSTDLLLKKSNGDPDVNDDYLKDLFSDLIHFRS